MRFVNTKNKTKKTVNNISKKVYNHSTTPTETQYLAGYQYISNVLQFFPTAEGYVNNTVVSGINQYSYVYNYTDHLGNIRLSYKKNGTTLQILEENNYYPFGLKHTYYNTTNAQPNYKYKYNGKEYQDELGLGWYDYHFRQYDPAIGRWNGLDPLCEKYFNYSPYIGYGDNPVLYQDSEGMDIIIKGSMSKQAVEQLQATTSLKLEFNENTGIVTASGEPKTNADKVILDASTRTDIRVGLVTDSDLRIDTDNSIYVGGAFRGNKKMTYIDSSGKSKERIVAHNIINVDALIAIDEAEREKKGTSVLHEFVEAYYGAVDSPGAPPATSDENNKKGYSSAHKKAEKITGENTDGKIGFEITRVKENGKVIKETISIYHIDNKGKKTTIYTAETAKKFVKAKDNEK